ncbi:MAG TPA: LapA family protein [Solirubrobacterales bacterium]
MPPVEKKPVNWRAWGIGALVALVLIVALQNSQEVSFDVLFASFQAPLIVILLVSVAIGAVIGYAFPVLRRHRREERRQRDGKG